MKYIILFLFPICILSCKNNKSNSWGVATFDSSISKSPIYKQLDEQNEFNNRLELDSSRKLRTSDVTYNSSKDYNCHIFYKSSDTLLITIGFGTGYVWKGFHISYSNGKFHTEPKEFQDISIHYETKPVVNIIEQDLSLNKPKYNVGDSLYGKINFHIIETIGEHDTEYYGNGYFRAKVKL
jgi:hypothetical protein